jgi:hypothetical protein
MHGSPISSAPEAPPFDEPWQAQVFAVAVSLERRGVFDGSEWTRALGAEIAAGPDQAVPGGVFPGLAARAGENSDR